MGKYWREFWWENIGGNFWWENIGGNFWWENIGGNFGGKILEEIFGGKILEVEKMIGISLVYKKYNSSIKDVRISIYTYK